MIDFADNNVTIGANSLLFNLEQILSQVVLLLRTKHIARYLSQIGQIG